MGYNYMSVMVSLEQVRAAWGSNDEALYALMCGEDAHRYTKYLMESAVRRRALRGYLEGELCGDARPHDNAYMIEAMCFQLGVSLGELDSRDDTRAGELARAASARCDVLMDLVGERWPVAIPDSVDFPFVGTRTAAQCAAWGQALDAALRAVEARGVSGWEQEQGLEGLRHMRAVCARVAGTDQDLIIFFH